MQQKKTQTSLQALFQNSVAEPVSCTADTQLITRTFKKGRQEAQKLSVLGWNSLFAILTRPFAGQRFAFRGAVLVSHSELLSLLLSFLKASQREQKC